MFSVTFLFKIFIKSMKTIKQILAVLTIGLSMTIARAQTINCSDLSLLGFGLDPINPGNSLIHILLGGNSMDFITYPYITIVTDCSGDTIATGSINFFGHQGQTVQSYPVTGDITSSCLPISVEFVYGNTNFETDTCTLTLSTLPPALTCNDVYALGIESDQFNTLVNISIQGSGNTYIYNSHISIVTDCMGDTIASGFFGGGQIGLSTQGYPITPVGNTICYPITVGFIYGNTNFETDTCLLTLNAPTAVVESMQMERSISIYPIPSSNKISISTDQKIYEKNYLIYDTKGKVMITGKIVSDNTILDISQLTNGLYFFKIEDNSGEIIKVVKQ